MAWKSFTLQPVTTADFTDVAKISSDSFQNDRHTLIKAHHLGKSPYNHEDASLEPLARYLKRPAKFQLIKAVENTSGKIMGSITWGFRGYTEANVPTLSGRGVNGNAAGQTDPTEVAKGDTYALMETEPRKDAAATGTVGKTPQSMPKDDFKNDEDDPIKRLTSITDADMKRWQEILMPEGTQCMFIVGLSVAPEYRGLGVGTALMRWGTASADADGVFCWVHSSESAHSFYAKEGFETVGALEVDLDEFAPGPSDEENGDGKWGHYVFRYMKRLPFEKA